MKRIIIFLILAISMFGFMGCGDWVDDADIASHNVSKDADNFKVYRRAVFYNGITNEYILEVQGYLSIEADTMDGQLEVTVKTENGTYLKHFLGLSDNVTYFVEQLEPSLVSDKRYKVVFKPSAIVPMVEVR